MCEVEHAITLEMLQMGAPLFVLLATTAPNADQHRIVPSHGRPPPLGTLRCFCRVSLGSAIPWHQRTAWLSFACELLSGVTTAGGPSYLLRR